MDKKEKQRRVTKQKRVMRIVFGVLLIGVGVLFTLDNLGVLEAGRLRGYWPLFLIGFGLSSWIAPKDAGDTVFGVILTAVGGFFLLRKFDLVEWRFWDVWPVVLIAAGVVLLAQTIAERRRLRDSGVPSLENGGAR